MFMIPLESAVTMKRPVASVSIAKMSLSLATPIKISTTANGINQSSGGISLSNPDLAYMTHKRLHFVAIATEYLENVS